MSNDQNAWRALDRVSYILHAGYIYRHPEVTAYIGDSGSADLVIEKESIKPAVLFSEKDNFDLGGNAMQVRKLEKPRIGDVGK